MKLLSSFLALSVGLLPPGILPSRAFAQPTSSSKVGIWQGYATVGAQQVPIIIRISRSGAKTLRAEFLNGPADHPDATPSSSATFEGTHLVASFDYFARTLDATLTAGKLVGTYGPTHTGAKSAPPIPFQATRGPKQADPESAPDAPDITGSWEIATKSSKGKSAWEFRVYPPNGKSPVVKTVIQRIDGDTGGLWGAGYHLLWRRSKR